MRSRATLRLLGSERVLDRRATEARIIAMGEGTLTCAAVRELDRRAIEEYGIPSLVLMENAGRACAEDALRLLPSGQHGPVLVLCGPGNNGGDGLVIARTLENRGVAVQVVFVGPRERLETSSPDVRTNLALWRGLGREVELLETAEEVAALLPRLARAALVVDALFGTGLARALAEPYVGVILALHASGRTVLAVDVPSGLDAETGAVLGAAVRADVTVTFVAQKSGFARGRGPELCGRVVVAEIGIPRAWIAAALRSGDELESEQAC